MSQMPRGEYLAVEMLRALPLFCYVDNRARQTLLQQGAAIGEGIRLEVAGVHYMGEAGGIMCAIKRPDDGKTIVMSATNLRFPDQGVIYDKINEYRKARIRWLQEEEQRPGPFGRSNREEGPLAHAADSRGEVRQKIPRNAPCPCGSGKKYKFCCMK